MRRLAILILLAGALGGAASAAEYAGSVGIGQGIPIPGGDSDPCPPSTLNLNYDGSAENGYCWQYGGIVPPYYGAFAECYALEYSYVCGIQLHLTGIGYPCAPFTAYVWEDAGGVPGNVLATVAGLNPCPVATWPSISTHDINVGSVFVNGAFWIGYWANWSAQPCGYFVAADTNGFGGCPFTNIAPGIGYPTGWNNVSAVWGPTQAIGIGSWGPGIPPPNPTVETSWGRIKTALQ